VPLSPLLKRTVAVPTLSEPGDAALPLIWASGVPLRWRSTGPLKLPSACLRSAPIRKMASRSRS
jgi:hypothetical protein